MEGDTQSNASASLTDICAFLVASTRLTRMTRSTGMTTIILIRAPSQWPQHSEWPTTIILIRAPFMWPEHSRTGWFPCHSVSSMSGKLACHTQQLPCPSTECADLTYKLPGPVPTPLLCPIYTCNNTSTSKFLITDRSRPLLYSFTIPTHWMS